MLIKLFMCFCYFYKYLFFAFTFLGAAWRLVVVLWVFPIFDFLISWFEWRKLGFLDQWSSYLYRILMKIQKKNGNSYDTIVHVMQGKVSLLICQWFVHQDHPILRLWRSLMMIMICATLRLVCFTTLFINYKWDKKKVSICSFGVYLH